MPDGNPRFTAVGMLADAPGITLGYEADGHLFTVVNPRPEYDAEDGCTEIVYDRVEIDGREMTDQESDEYLDDLRTMLRAEDWSE